jgi:hypothetical protein
MPTFAFFMDNLGAVGGSSNPRNGVLWLADAATPQDAVTLVRPFLTEGRWYAVNVAQGKTYDVKMNPTAVEI